MSQDIRRFSPRDETTDIVEEIRENGVVIIENLHEPAIMDLLRTKVEAELDGKQPGGGDPFGNKKRSMGALLARGREFSDHLLGCERTLELTDAILLPAVPMAAGAQRMSHDELTSTNPYEAFSNPVDPLVGPNCHHYRINATVAMQVCRGGSNQTLHRDEWRYLPFHAPRPRNTRVDAVQHGRRYGFYERERRDPIHPGKQSLAQGPQTRGT